MLCPCSTGQPASGFILIYLRSPRPGDCVRVADCEGTVKDIGLFTMTMTTPFNEVVSLPTSWSWAAR